MSKNILITGSKGFIGKNLINYFKYNFKDFNLILTSHNDNIKEFKSKLLNCDFIIHLSGVNRPKDINEFNNGNYLYTNKICEILINNNKNIPIIFTSTIHIGKQYPTKIHAAYSKSKLRSEICLKSYAKKMNTCVYIYRLPHIIGKWCKPNYNSVVSTFCYNIARHKNIIINKPNQLISFIHIDDLIINFQKLLNKKFTKNFYFIDVKCHKIKLRILVDKLRLINSSIDNTKILNLTKKIDKILYSTFLTYLPKSRLLLNLNSNSDYRGNFIEVFKRNDFGQVSYLTSKPNIIRGNHFHNMKCEIFIVIAGKAQYLSKSLNDKISYKVILKSSEPKLIRTVPGEVHQIKNIGNTELIVLLWANDVFNKKSPDTYYIND